MNPTRLPDSHFFLPFFKTLLETSSSFTSGKKISSVKSNPKTTFLSFPKSGKRASGFVGSSFSDSVRQRELLILSCPISLHLPSNKDLQIS